MTLVSGPTSLAAPTGVQRIDVVSARQMFDAVKTHVERADIFIAVAAVADYRPATTSEQKIKKSDRALKIELVPTDDILAYVAGLPRPPFCVGFAAESEKLIEHAHEKRKRKKVPLLAANLAQHAIGADENELVLLDDSGMHPVPRGSKESVARTLIERVIDLYATSPQTSHLRDMQAGVAPLTDAR